MINFDEIIDRTGTDSLKYDGGPAMNPYLPDEYLPMWVADMDFACPQPVLDAMKERLDRRILGYSMLLDPGYFEIVTGWFWRRHGWRVDADSIVFSSGVVSAMHTAVERLTKPGDGVLLNTPAYHPFDDTIKRFGRTPVYSPLLYRDGTYTIDYEDLERKAKDPHNTLFFFCSPHNPTGRVWREEELRRVAQLCFANGVFVVCDEIHSDILRKGETHIPLAKLFPGETRIITCTSPSKTFNLAGNQLANLVVADKALAKEWRGMQACGFPNPLSIAACRAAYTQCDEWAAQMNEYVDENFALVKRRLRDDLPKAKFSIGQGTYLAWIDLSGFGLTDRQLKERISRAGLFIEFGDEFVANGEGFVRINLACPRALVEKAMDILAGCLGESHA